MRRTLNQKTDEVVSDHPTPSVLFHLFPVPALVIAAAAFAVVAPMIFLGNPSGHDFDFHLNSWMEIVGQWRQGIIYPRWAALAHYGYGEARFLFYPPASWVLGALLGLILPWRVVPGAYVWVALSAAGVSMFLLARRWVPQRDAIFAAALYAANPYHVVIVYWRSAYAELLASSLLPLLLLFVLRSEEEGRRIIVPLSLVVAAAWLTNAPSAVMVNYSLALLVVAVAIVRRNPRPLFYGAAAVALGAGLAGYYIIPAAFEERWVNIAEVLAPGVRPQDNFLFMTTGDADHNNFNRLVSIVAIAEMACLAGAVFFSRKRSWRASENHALWWTLAGWGFATAVAMFSFTFIFWEHLPRLRFVQLPWRWLLCMNVAFAVFVTLAFRRWWMRLVVCSVMFSVLWFGWHRVQPPWWDEAADIADVAEHQANGEGYEGTDEYVPAGDDPYELSQSARRAEVQGGGRSHIRIQEWSPESKQLIANTAQPGKVVLKLFNYPAWTVLVNDKVVTAASHPVTGQIVIPINAGESRVRLVFARTWDRSYGIELSLIALLLVVVLVLRDYFTRRHRITRTEATT